MSMIQEMRMELWIKVFMRHLEQGAMNKTAAGFADHAVEQFNERFS